MRFRPSNATPYSLRVTSYPPLFLLVAFVAFRRVPSNVTAFCHGLSPEEGAVEAYLRRFATDGRIKFPGATGRVEVEGWPELVKVNLEASFLVQGGIFVSWETSLAVPVLERPASDLLERSSHALRSAAAAFGLEFEATTS
jgi:hypothetical protein